MSVRGLRAGKTRVEGNPRWTKEMRVGPPRAAHGATVAVARHMSFASVVDRVRADFIELPALELTLAQAVRLWHLGADDCRYVLDALVDAGFLTWTAEHKIRRVGVFDSGEAHASHVAVRRRPSRDRQAAR